MSNSRPELFIYHFSKFLIRTSKQIMKSEFQLKVNPKATLQAFSLTPFPPERGPIWHLLETSLSEDVASEHQLD